MFSHYFLFFVSFFDSFIIFPLNSEAFLLKLIKEKQNVKNKINIFVSLYIFPSLLGSLVSYLIGFMFSQQMKYFIQVISSILFGGNKIEKLDYNYLYKALLSKSVLPGVPISLINYSFGIYNINITFFILCSIFVRIIRSIIIILFGNKVNSDLVDMLLSCVIVSTFLQLFVFFYYQFLIYV